MVQEKTHPRQTQTHQEMIRWDEGKISMCSFTVGSFYPDKTFKIDNVCRKTNNFKKYVCGFQVLLKIDFNLRSKVIAAVTSHENV